MPPRTQGRHFSFSGEGGFNEKGRPGPQLHPGWARETYPQEGQKPRRSHYRPKRVETLLVRSPL